MEALISVDSVSKNYGSEQILDSISFTINKGDKVALIGKNGAGKSTLLNIICKISKQSNGQVSYNLEKKAFYDNFGIQMQDAIFDERLTVLDYCKLLEKLFGIESVYPKYLTDFNLEDKKNKKISQLSGGERQKLNIICALIHDPNVLIFDEITTGLDTINRNMVKEYIETVAGEKTLVLVSHYMEEIEHLCNRVICIHEGKLICNDSVENIQARYGTIENFYIKEVGGNTK